MKNIVTINIVLVSAILAFFSINVTAQNSINRDSMVYLTEEEEAFRLHQETKYLLKLLPLAYERKISKSVSLSALMYRSAIGSDVLISNNFGLGLEGRYYYQMKKNIETGKQANNLSGNYISVAGFGGISLLIDRSQDTLALDISPSYGMTIGIGNQKRLYDYFYWDSGFQVEFLRSTRGSEIDEFTSITLSRKSRLAISFGYRKKSSPKDAFPKIKVHENNNYSLRYLDGNNIALTRLANSNDFEDHWQFTIIPTIVSELKIAETSFSLINDVKARINFSTLDTENVNIEQARKPLYRLRMGGRYYYKMKKRIREGKGGNNFTGAYISTMLSYQNTSDLSGNLLFALAGWGYQKEVGKKFFLNFDISIPIRISGDGLAVNGRGITSLLPGEFGLRIGRRLY